MRLYTRGGDTGETSLFDGTRVSKDHPRVAAYGDVDELNSMLGWCRCADDGGLLRERMDTIQRELFILGAELATPAGSQRNAQIPHLSAEDIRRLEVWIDEAVDQTGPLRNFILPGGTELASRLHVTRTACRRAERAVTALGRGGEVHPDVIVYLNRLGDLLFAWARLANYAGGLPDVPWVVTT